MVDSTVVPPHTPAADPSSSCYWDVTTDRTATAQSHAGLVRRLRKGEQAARLLGMLRVPVVERSGLC